MAFQFNWSPLIADTERAREMLTSALNKSPKPSIIVDDILVTELNLGSTPPSLEILEIGDLAEDRFRGIFKMVYSGDAFLTLRTRVQANPLNTYLATTPTFASPQPLAAASGLTIPLAITLSDIRLSGFVILVFSKQKGITLVFRNDPLESLKVSSTFDSIPFVRDYLQSEIEKQLRVLFMEDLPAIIHRLSLRLLVPPDHQQISPVDLNSNPRLDSTSLADEPRPIDPLASPPQMPADEGSEVLNGASFNLDDSSASYSFSRKNLLRLAALNDSHRTLSLFTPPIRDAVIRAWAGAAEQVRDEHCGPLLGGRARSSGLTLASLRGSTVPAEADKTMSRSKSLQSNSSDGRPVSLSGSAASAPQSYASSRPTVAGTYTSYSSNTYNINGMVTTSSARPRARKRKHRVVNLRRTTETNDVITSPDEQSHAQGGTDPQARPTTPTSTTAPESSSWRTTSSREEDELVTPPDSPENKKADDRTPQAPRQHRSRAYHDSETIRPSRPPMPPHKSLRETLIPDAAVMDKSTLPPLAVADSNATIVPDSNGKGPLSPSATSPSSPPLPSPNFAGSTQPGGILEQAWLMKMAAEIARKAESERRRQSEEFWNGKWDAAAAGEGSSRVGGEPPPAYSA